MLSGRKNSPRPWPTRPHRATSSPTELTLRDSATGQFQRVRRDTLASVKDLGSLLPAGLADQLDRKDLRDLIRFLAGLGKPTP